MTWDVKWRDGYIESSTSYSEHERMALVAHLNELLAGRDATRINPIEIKITKR